MKKTKFEAAPLSAHIQAGAIMRLLHEYTVASVTALEDISTQKEIAKMRSIIRNVEELRSVYDAKLHQMYGDKITVGDNIDSPTRHIFYGDLTNPPRSYIDAQVRNYALILSRILRVRPKTAAETQR